MHLGPPDVIWGPTGLAPLMSSYTATPQTFPTLCPYHASSATASEFPETRDLTGCALSMRQARVMG